MIPPEQRAGERVPVLVLPLQHQHAVDLGELARGEHDLVAVVVVAVAVAAAAVVVGGGGGGGKAELHVCVGGCSEWVFLWGGDCLGGGGTGRKCDRLTHLICQQLNLAVLLVLLLPVLLLAASFVATGGGGGREGQGQDVLGEGRGGVESMVDRWGVHMSGWMN